LLAKGVAVMLMFEETPYVLGVKEADGLKAAACIVIVFSRVF